MEIALPTRYLRPGIRDSEVINALSPIAETLFYRLLVTVDDFGRTDARPSMIKAHCFPIKDDATADVVSDLLLELVECKLVQVYAVEGKPYLQVLKWDNVPRAKESKFPAPDDERAQMHTFARNPRAVLPVTVTGTGTDNREPKPGLHAAQVQTEAQSTVQAVCRETWEAYAGAYSARYQAPPLRNAKSNSLIKRFAQLVPAEEAAAIARHYVEHNGQFYVAKLHPLELLVADAAKLRTEWATGRMMTTTRARQVDRGGSMMDIVNEIKRERGEA